ncbi:MAG: hypothetical protein V2J89_03590, partial [Halieaceae bacterium]|nr:hypothetical protein [Halieaceae bacterium]
LTVPQIARSNKTSKLLILLALKIPVSAVRFCPWAPYSYCKVLKEKDFFYIGQNHPTFLVLLLSPSGHVSGSSAKRAVWAGLESQLYFLGARADTTNAAI